MGAILLCAYEFLPTDSLDLQVVFKTLEHFIEAHGWDEASRHSNPFQRSLDSGQMIASVGVENAGDEDDDWLAFEFGPPDAAIAPSKPKP